MKTQIETTVGIISIEGGSIREDREDSGTTYEVAIRVSLGLRTVNGDASIGENGRATGDSVDCWLSPGVRALLDVELPEREHAAVLGAIEAFGAEAVSREGGCAVKRTWV